MDNNIPNPKESSICIDFANQFYELQMLRQIPSSFKIIRIPNEGFRTSKFGGRLKAEGWTAGYPDYFILKGSKWAAIEFKRANNSVLSPAQKLFSLWCSENKVPHLITSSSKEAINFIMNL